MQAEEEAAADQPLFEMDLEKIFSEVYEENKRMLGNIPKQHPLDIDDDLKELLEKKMGYLCIRTMRLAKAFADVRTNTSSTTKKAKKTITLTKADLDNVKSNFFN